MLCCRRGGCIVNSKSNNEPAQPLEYQRADLPASQRHAPVEPQWWLGETQRNKTLNYEVPSKPFAALSKHAAVLTMLAVLLAAPGLLMLMAIVASYDVGLAIAAVLLVPLVVAACTIVVSVVAKRR